MSKVTTAGKRFYETHLKAVLEPQENGKFVAIEPESEKYFVGATAVEALTKSREQFPDKIFFLARVGFPSAYKIGGYGRRIG